MTKKTKVFSVGFLSVIFALILAAAFFGYQLVMMPISSDSSEVIFDINPGDSLARISNTLQQQRLIRNAKAFQIYAKFRGQASRFKVGEYALNAAMSPDEIMAVLVSGKSVARKITFAEGLNIYDLAQIFEKSEISTREEFMALVKDKEFIRSLLNEDLNSLEGYLYPETYQVTKFEGARGLITQMVRRFLQVWNAEIEPHARASGWSRNQVVIFASIVEKETGAAFERPIVSSVFHNRLQKNMRLQTDPTVLYGMAVKQGKMPINISKKDLQTPTPYNSYTNAGLPPTPIANPGKEALQAALRPASTKYLYFVSKNNGTHVFSETLQEHNRAVQDFQMNRKARENKSWRDLKQEPPVKISN